MNRELLQRALDVIDRRFKSGNAIPVERAMVLASEWAELRDALAVGDSVSPGEPVALDAIYAAWHSAGVDIAGGDWEKFAGKLPPIYTHAIPPGFVLVPVEPTWDMKMAASTAYREPRDGHYTARMECAENAYRAMIAAAPKVTP